MKNALIRSVVVGAALCLGATLKAQDNKAYAAAPTDHTEISKNTGTNPSSARRLETVATRVIANAGRYYRDQGLSGKFIAIDWDYQLIDANETAIYALPSGKVGVYSGLADRTATDDQLAYLVGHAIGHVLSGHRPRRRERNAPAGAPGGARAWACLENFNTAPAQNYRDADEAEADRLALVFMRAAGYDVQESLRFWDQLKVAKQGDSGPCSERKKDLQTMIPGIVAAVSPGEQEAVPAISRDTAVQNTPAISIPLTPQSVPGKGNYVFIMADVLPVSGFRQEQIAPLETLGTVYTDEISLDGRPYLRILLGGITDAEDARKKQAAARELGFKKADVVEYRNGKRVRSGG
ncbi:MAG: M48 family metalloprotease [Lewinellaceae bacterium]|nr:M48 family metalloprotease [Lewinellaceae bacterium]